MGWCPLWTTPDFYPPYNMLKNVKNMLKTKVAQQHYNDGGIIVQILSEFLKMALLPGETLPWS